MMLRKCESFRTYPGNPRCLNPKRARESSRLQSPVACRWTMPLGRYSVWKPRIRGCERVIRSEVQWLKKLYKQVLQDICKKNEEAEDKRHLLDKTIASLWSQEKAVQEALMKRRDLEEKMTQFASKLPRFKTQGSLNVTVQWGPNT